MCTLLAPESVDELLAAEPEAVLDSELSLSLSEVELGEESLESESESESESDELFEDELEEPPVADGPSSVAVPVAMIEESPLTTETPVSTPLPPKTAVVELPTLTVKYETEAEMLSGTVVTPDGKPAGIVARVGWAVSPSGSSDCSVATAGMPVMTPRESVWVK